MHNLCRKCRRCSNVHVLFQEDDPDKHKSWFKLGADIGLEIVDDEEVEAEVDEIEVDEEVARIYEDAKQRHRKIMTSGFK